MIGNCLRVNALKCIFLRMLKKKSLRNEKLFQTGFQNIQSNNRKDRLVCYVSCTCIPGTSIDPSVQDLQTELAITFMFLEIVNWLNILMEITSTCVHVWVEEIQFRK